MMDKKIFSFKIYPTNKNISKTWFVLVINNITGARAKKYGHMAKFNTIDERIKEANRIIKEVTQQGFTRKQNHTDIIVLLQKGLNEKMPSLEGNSIDNYNSAVKLFAQWYRPAAALDKNIDPGQFINFLYSKGYNRNYMRKLRSILQNLLTAAGWENNPFQLIKIKKVKPVSLLPFSAKQIDELKKYMQVRDPQLWDAAQFMYYMYFRPDELRLLKIGDILFDEMQYSMRPEMCKDDDCYLKNIPAPLQDRFKKLKGLNNDWYIFSHKGQPGATMLGENNLSNRHLKMLKELSYSKRYAFYSWVHTGCKAGTMAGIPIKQLQMQKGHSDLRMFDEYLKNLCTSEFTQLRNNFPEI